MEMHRGHRGGQHHGYVPPSGLSCPYCGYYYGPAGRQGLFGLGASHGPPSGWTSTGYDPVAGPLRSDEDIRRMAYGDLKCCLQITPRPQIHVEVREGVVALTGSVPNIWVKYAVSEIIFGVPGVVDVQNNLQVTQLANRRSEIGGAT